jgi:hypothetical protein
VKTVATLTRNLFAGRRLIWVDMGKLSQLNNIIEQLFTVFASFPTVVEQHTRINERMQTHVFESLRLPVDQSQIQT